MVAALLISSVLLTYSTTDDSPFQLIPPPKSYSSKFKSSTYTGTRIAIKDNLLIISNASNMSEDSDYNSVQIFRFNKSKKKWNLEDELKYPGKIKSNSGFGAEIATNGKYIVISAPGSGYEKPIAGEVFIYSYLKKESRWDLFDTLQPKSNTTKRFGDRIAISDKHLLVRSRISYKTNVNIYELKSTKISNGTVLDKPYSDDWDFASDIDVTNHIAIVRAKKPSWVVEYKWNKYQIFRDDHPIDIPGSKDKSFSGHSISHSLSSDGRYLLIDAEYRRDGKLDRQTVYLYRRNKKDKWELVSDLAKVTPERDHNLKSLRSFAMSGSMIAVGLPFSKQGTLVEAGEVLFYQLESDKPAYLGTWASPHLNTYAHWGSQIAMDDGKIAVSAPWAQPDNRKSSGAVYVADIDLVTNNFKPTPTKVEQDLQDVPVITASHFPMTGLEPYDYYGTEIEVLQGSNHAIVFVGAQGKSVYGEVYVWQVKDSNWKLIDNLKPSVKQKDIRFGTAIAANERFLAVGAPRTHHSSREQDMVFVYDRTASDKWEERVVLRPKQNKFSMLSYGSSLAFLNDWLIVGAPLGHLSDKELMGVVYIYRLESSGWQLFQTITTSELDSKGSSLGYSIVTNSSVHDDILIGAPMANGQVLHSRWDKEEYKWKTIGILKAPKIDGLKTSSGHATFGSSIAIGNTVLGANLLAIGAPTLIHSKDKEGAVFLYDYSNTGDIEYDSVILPDNRHQVGGFGSNILIDGMQGSAVNLFIAENNYEVGEVSWYKKYPVQLQYELQYLVNPSSEMIKHNSFGLALAQANSQLIIGSDWASKYGPSNTAYGALYAIDQKEPGRNIEFNVDIPEKKKLTSQISTNIQQLIYSDHTQRDNFGHGVYTEEDIAIVSAPAAKISGVSYAGAVVKFMLNMGAKWVENEVFTASKPEPDAQFGYTFDRNGDYIAIGAPYGNSKKGRVSIFKGDLGSNYKLSTELTDQGGVTYDNFGFTVALSTKRLAVAAMGYKKPSKVIIYDRKKSDKWEVTGTIHPEVITEDSLFGWQLAWISTEKSDYVLVADPAESQNAIFLYKETKPGTWKIIEVIGGPGDQPKSFFGCSIDTSPTSNPGHHSLIVGSFLYNTDSSWSTGSAYLYSISTGTDESPVTLHDSFIARNTDSSNYFGRGVAISENRFAIGSPGFSEDHQYMGNVSTYEYMSSDFIKTELGQIEPPNPKYNMRCGEAVDIDSSGTSLIFGCGDLLAKNSYAFVAELP